MCSARGSSGERAGETSTPKEGKENGEEMEERISFAFHPVAVSPA